MLRAGWRSCVRASLVLCAYLIVAPSAAAATNPYRTSITEGPGGLSDAYTQCIAAVGKGDRSDCIAKEYDRQDTRLNAAYKKLAATLDEHAANALRDDERVWIAQRSKACGGTPSAITRNACALEQTTARAGALEKRLRGSDVASSGEAAISGDWGYNSDCDTGHYVEFSVKTKEPDVVGTWSDGTRVHGNQGQFKGQLRDGRLYVRLCAEDDERGGYPVCPAYSEVDGYVAQEGSQLVWYRLWGARSENTFKKYVTLSRKPHGGDVPTDTRCPTGAK